MMTSTFITIIIRNLHCCNFYGPEEELRLPQVISQYIYIYIQTQYAIQPQSDSTEYWSLLTGDVDDLFFSYICLHHNKEATTCQRGTWCLFLISLKLCCRVFRRSLSNVTNFDVHIFTLCRVNMYILETLSRKQRIWLTKYIHFVLY